MYKDLKGKVVVITGGSGFLGKQYSEAFLRNKCKVINLDLINRNKKVLFLKCDITREAELILAKKKILKNFKKIDILINNAAKNPVPLNKNKSNTFENLDIKELEKDFQIGLIGAILSSKIFGSQMLKQKKGNIINISSDLGIIAPDQRLYKKNFVKPVSYSVVKHGILGLTKYLASYWGKKNIRCNAFAPGGMKNIDNISIQKKIKKLIPINRMANKNEYNDIILFLASNSSSYVNGATIVADGGRSII
jgi:NAD(P)-dependent dehydrogenase (short-subunit alcohol dehydrogenase family)